MVPPLPVACCVLPAFHQQAVPPAPLPCSCVGQHHPPGLRLHGVPHDGVRSLVSKQNLCWSPESDWEVPVTVTMGDAGWASCRHPGAPSAVASARHACQCLAPSDTGFLFPLPTHRSWYGPGFYASGGSSAGGIAYKDNVLPHRCQLATGNGWCSECGGATCTACWERPVYGQAMGKHKIQLDAASKQVSWVPGTVHPMLCAVHSKARHIDPAEAACLIAWLRMLAVAQCVSACPKGVKNCQQVRIFL